jgi:hypothetical protein
VNAASRQTGAQSIFGVSASGYQGLGAVLSATKAQLDAVQSAAAQYVAGLDSSAAGSTVDSTLQDFYNQQTTILQAVPSALKSKLSQADWVGLQAFITTGLVGKIKVGVLTNAK